MNVLMVCLGNICRSPLAEGVLRDKIEQRGLDWSVDSAGTSKWHAGESPDPRSVETAHANGIDISSQRARQFTVDDFDRFDLILVMDSSNYRNVVAMSRSEEDTSKVRLLLNYSYPGENRAVPDPYYEGGFQNVYDLIEEAVELMINQHS